MTSELSFRPRVRLPANLTVRFSSEAITAADPRGWCEQRAEELLGQRARGRDVQRLAGCLEEHLEFFRSEMPLITAALCFYPDYSTLPPRAMVQVKAFGGDRLLSMDEMRNFYATPDEMSVGNTELTETELQSGPAIRVHWYRKAEPDKRRSMVVEEIVWLVWPPGSMFTVAMTTSWGQPAFSKAGAVIADQIARNFRAEPKS